LLNLAIKDQVLRDRLVTVFNDKDPELAKQLQAAINVLPKVETLAYQPQVTNYVVGKDMAEMLRNINLVPTLFFIDPWGYKGLSLDLIGQAIKSWGCDCIFFFNYNRVNPGLNNPSVVERMTDLFGATRLDELRAKVTGRTSNERQTLIIDALTDALGELGGQFVLPFEFEMEQDKRPSHYIIFVSKEFRGYHIMKEVMAGLSSDEGEVKKLEYVPMRSSQMSLFNDLGRTHSIATLKDLLGLVCTGTTDSVVRIYETHTVGTPYTLKNVKDALRELEADGRVVIDPPANKRPKRKGEVTLADDKIVTFPLE